MGNKQSANHIDITDINTNYVFETKFTDTRFGEIKLLKKRDSNERIFQKDFSTNSSQEFEEYIKKIKDRLPLLHPNLIKVLGYNSKKEDLLCADFYKVSLFFEAFETDLEKEIQKRSENKNYYTEPEIRVMLDSLIAVGAFLERNQVAHGDIRPYNIFITKNREYMLCDNSLFYSAYSPSYFGVLEGLEAKSHYPGPQVFKNYRQSGGKPVEFNKYKNDVYGLGLSVLSAAKLQKVDDVYDYNKKVVKQETVDGHLKSLQGRYSEGLIEALGLLLQQDEVHRPSFSDLDDEIRIYRSDTRSRANLERVLQDRRAESQKANPAMRTPREAQAGAANAYTIDDELDRRVRKAVEISEKMINKSPSKYKHNVLDSYIHTYIKKDPLPEDQPLLYTISPFLKMQPRLVPTLKIYPQENAATSQYRPNPHDMSNQVFSSGIGPNSHVIHEERNPTYQTGSFGVNSGYGSNQQIHHHHEGYGQENVGYNTTGANYTSGNYGSGNYAAPIGSYDSVQQQPHDDHHQSDLYTSDPRLANIQNYTHTYNVHQH